jgi:competence protein ComEC
LKLWGLLILGAVSPFLFVSALPGHVALVLLLLTALTSLLVPFSRTYCLFPTFFLITTLAIDDRLAERLPLSKNRTVSVISGVVASLPLSNEDLTSFIFLPDDPTGLIPSRIRVSWYEDRRGSEAVTSSVPHIRAGEHWRLKLELRSPRGRVNFHGVDAERWYFTDGIGALAYVQDGENIRLDDPDWFNLQHRRESLLDQLKEKAGDTPAFRILAALAIADRRGMHARDRQILSATGTGHLLAISGLHIGLAASMGFYLGRLCLLLLGIGPKQVYAVVLPWAMAWLAALSYAALSGFGVSTQRALIMLSVATVVTLGRRNIHPFLSWMVAMALVLILDPFAPLRAGFWFSFLAVAVLMMVFVPRHGHMSVWKKMLFAQLGITLVMAPLSMYWFQQASLPGLLANLIAIPVVSLLIVPLILIGLLFLYLPLPLAEWSLGGAAYLSGELFHFLDFMMQFQPDILSSTAEPRLLTTVLAMMGAAIILLPKGVPGRYAGLLLVLPIIFSPGQSLDKAESRVDFLDVGQGLAVLLTDRDYLMVYDTGPGNGRDGERGWDMVDTSIRPMIKATGRSPDLIVASHADLDHAGGLMKLQTVYPQALFLASLPRQKLGVQACRAPDAWQTENLGFRILHPSAGLPYLGNDSSCVISVIGPRLSILLSGDISRVVEQRLVNEGVQHHAILTVPHHGSSTSSSQVLIDTVRPSWALISSGLNNRFDFPRADVLKRYSNALITTFNTAQCGGIRVTTRSNGGFLFESARVIDKTLWRWPAADICPE